jgi:3-oxoadipate enol-lactonase
LRERAAIRRFTDAMPVSEVNGVELYWERGGSGPRLLFCNGSGSTLTDAGPLLDAFAGQFDLLAWDYRGLGHSGPAAASYRMADLAADAVGLLELVGWRTCRVVGVSFGGMVAQELAVTDPERLERLALICTSAGGHGGSSYPLQRLLELSPQDRAAAGLTLTDSRWDDRWLAGHPGDRALAERVAARPAPAGAAGVQAQLLARADHDVWERLEAITCPTLVAYGRYDGIAPAENSAAIAARIPQADLRGYEGGHLFLAQDPAAMPELVTFLRSPEV